MPKRIRLENWLRLRSCLPFFVYKLFCIQASVAVTMMTVNCSCRSDCLPQSYLLEGNFIQFSFLFHSGSAKTSSIVFYFIQSVWIFMGNCNFKVFSFLKYSLEVGVYEIDLYFKRSYVIKKWFPLDSHRYRFANSAFIGMICGVKLTLQLAALEELVDTILHFGKVRFVHLWLFQLEFKLSGQWRSEAIRILDDLDISSKKEEKFSHKLSIEAHRNSPKKLNLWSTLTEEIHGLVHPSK